MRKTKHRLSETRREPQEDSATEACRHTAILSDNELDAATGGFIVDGCMQALGGPDTKVSAGADLLRSKSLDRN